MSKLQYEDYNGIAFFVSFVVIVAVGYIVHRMTRKPRNSDGYEDKCP